MAEINFPSNPSDNDTHTDIINGTVWTYSSSGGWSKPNLAGGTPDSFVFGDAATKNMVIGIEQPITTGVSNTVLGFGLATISTGVRNTLIGAEAGHRITTTHDNVIIGYQASENMSQSTANNNVVIGSVAAKAQNNIVDCIILGYAAVPQAVNNVNSIVIGKNAIGKGTNTVVLGNDLITDTYLKGRVHFQTNSVLLANLPDPTTTPAGTIVWVSDSTAIAGGVHCSCNGTNWVIMGTATPVT